jgi:cob(I)alamin adenosyltransferase
MNTTCGGTTGCRNKSPASTILSIVKIYTRKGDDGSTGLFYGGRVWKDGVGPEAYGTVDEAVSFLGLARSRAEGTMAQTILDIQRGLFVVAAELATAAENRGKLEPEVSLVTEEMVENLEKLIDDVESRHGVPSEFVVPGQTELAAALDIARSVVRRAERRAISLARSEGLEDFQVIRYLNRLADYLYVLARAAEDEWMPSRSHEE